MDAQRCRQLEPHGVGELRGNTRRLVLEQRQPELFEKQQLDGKHEPAMGNRQEHHALVQAQRELLDQRQPQLLQLGNLQRRPLQLCDQPAQPAGQGDHGRAGAHRQRRGPKVDGLRHQQQRALATAGLPANGRQGAQRGPQLKHQLQLEQQPQRQLVGREALPDL